MKSPRALEDYIEAALKTARCEKIDNGKRVYSELPDFPGAWADGDTRAEAAAALKQVLRGWIALQIERGQPLPRVKGISTRELSLA